VIVDRSGNLYGTTWFGGANGGGNVFKIAPDGTYKVLYSFCSQSNCADGDGPLAGLIIDSSGNLYGTTTFGGANGGGTAFKLAAKGTETVLYNFCSRRHCSDGAGPSTGVVMDSSGNLYGTTINGGRSCRCGSVFKLAPNGTETTLYSFTAGSDGYEPNSVILDSAGNLYGTTPFGGTNGSGNVFEVSPDGTFKLLYSFCSQANCTDGANPQAGLIMDNSGNLYGTANGGGMYGYGTVFKLAANVTETTLYTFCSKGDCRDGAFPAAGLMMDGSGNLYGTTQFGIGRDCYDRNPDQCGTVFKLATNGTETALYSFCSKAGCADGLTPAGSLTMDGSGKLYGTTFQGGKGHCIDGCGTVFELDPALPLRVQTRVLRLQLSRQPRP
jgi:uncharacterized repeat protein (TIGR03803 family)